MAIGVRRRQPPSGAQRRKAERIAKVKTANKKLTRGELLTLDMTGAPNTYDEWRLEGRMVYWEMRKRKLDLDSGKALTWAADMNARMAKMAEELYELRQINRQLQQLQRGEPLPHQEYLPANEGDDE